MQLSKKDIKTLVSCGRFADMPDGMYITGFDDYDGRHYPIYVLDAYYYAGRDCELYTHLWRTLGGIECYLRFY